MTTWRDLADQLTPAQIDNLEWLETDSPPGLLDKPEQHLMLARGWAADNLEQAWYADVVPPAGAVEVGPWNVSKGVRRRDFRVAETGIAGLDITVETRGVQNTDGSVDGHLALTGEGLGALDPAAARQLAAALLAAAEGLEGRP